MSDNVCSVTKYSLRLKNQINLIYDWIHDMIHIVVKNWYVTSYHFVLLKKDRIFDFQTFYDNDRDKTLQIIIFIVTIKEIDIEDRITTDGYGILSNP